MLPVLHTLTLLDSKTHGVSRRYPYPLADKHHDIRKPWRLTVSLQTLGSQKIPENP